MDSTNLFIGIGGIVLLVFYFLRYNKNKEYIKSGVKATGIVIDVVQNYDHSRDRYFYPIVRFSLADGTWMTEKYSDGTVPSLFKKGDKVEILYKINDPTSFIITTGISKHTNIIFLVIGVLMLSYSIYYFIK